MQIKNLKKTYNKKGTSPVFALRDLTFTLPERGLVFIVGRSGSGKSTLLNLLSGLDSADEGRILLGDTDLCKLSPSQLDAYRNSCCGFVFQEYDLIPELNVEDNIALALEMQGQKDSHDEVCSVLERVGLKGYEKRKVLEMSGGQKQRVAIARAIVKDPKIVFADEPTGSLDRATGEDIFLLLKELSKDRLVIVVSHDTDSAQKYGDRVIELEDGRIIRDSSPCDTKVSRSPLPAQWKRSKLPLKTAIKIGCSNFKYHPIRMIATIVLAVIAFSLLGFAINASFIDPTSVTADALLKNDPPYFILKKVNAVDDPNFTADKFFGDSGKIEEATTITKADIDALRSNYPSKIYPVKEIFVNAVQLSIVADADQLNKAYELMPDVYFATTINGFIALSEEDIYKLGYSMKGRLPLNADEIAIEETLVDSFKIAGLREDGKIYPITNSEDVIGHKIDVGVLGNIPHVANLKTVTGIIDTGCSLSEREQNHYFTKVSAYENCAKFHEKVYVTENFFDEWDLCICESTKNKKSMTAFVSSVFDQMKEEEYFKLQHDSIDGLYGMIPSIVVYRHLFAYVAIIVFIIAFVFLVNFVATSMRSQTEQIGILSALGADFKQLVKIYLCGALILGLAIFALSVIGTAVSATVFDYSIIKMYGNQLHMISFDPIMLVILCSMIAFTVVLGTILPILRIRKYSPVEKINLGRIK